MKSIKSILTEMKFSDQAKKEIKFFNDVGILKTGFVDFENTMSPMSDSQEALIQFEKLLKKHAPKAVIKRSAKFIGTSKEGKDMYGIEVNVKDASNDELSSYFEKIMKAWKK